MSFEEDYAYGKLQEKLMFRYLRQFFGKLLIHNDNEFAPFDFQDPTTLVEMKSRKVNSYDYNTAMIKTLKIERCEFEKSNNNMDCFLVFSFLDKLCYIEYNKAQFSKYEKKYMLIKSRVDFTEKYEWRTFIPISDLKVLKVFPVQCMILD
jgi:hypothetical protein